MFKIPINRLFSCQISRQLYNKSQWDEQLSEKAVSLIFSERKYLDFTPDEKKIVDSYQKKLLDEDGSAILPNTGADLEHQQLQEFLLKRKMNTQK